MNGCGEKNISSLPYYNTPDFTPSWVSSTDAEKMHSISDFKFTDQDGNTFSSNEVKDKIYLADFFFTKCPGICPSMTKNLLKIQNAFGNFDDVRILSYSVMPENDSVKALKEYEMNYGIKNHFWYLLTGSTSDIYNLARRSYFVEKNAGFNSDSTEFLHTENIILIDKKGHIRGIYNGTLALDMERIINDINILLIEN